MALFSWILCTFLACERSEKTDIEPVSVDADGDGFAFEEDCDDTNAVTYPGADEVCDGVDNDCDGVVDAQDPDIADAITQYEDADGDGAGGGYVMVTCTPIEGYVSSSEDCDDLDSNTHPGADEVCDGVDNNCDGEIDEGVALIWYADADFDGYGDADNVVQACQEPPGYVYNALDCDDLSASTHPGSYEICDGVDNDCDGEIDVNAINADHYYLDEDLDGYGDPVVSTTACSLPEGYSDSADDCDDSNDAIHPAASELCDGYDNNCDGLIDGADATDATAWYLDFDVDGFGNPLISMNACSQPSGYVTDSTDCDDVNTEAYPGADEICDLMDNDCDGDIDENDATDATTWYLDSDSDGYGIDVSQQACNQPTGYVDNSTDCNDSDVTISPGAAEVCDEIDNDCDGDIDEADAIDVTTWYLDSDADGYGDPDQSLISCEQPSDYIIDGSDCDDQDINVFPGAAELWYDGIDSDCAGDDDYDADGDGRQSYQSAGGSDCDDTDPDVYVCGSSAGSALESCDEILTADSTLTTDGFYWIDPDSSGAIEAYCDMTTDGGGWTLFGNVVSAGFAYGAGTSQVPVSVSLTDTMLGVKPVDTIARMQIVGPSYDFDLVQSSVSGAYVSSTNSGSVGLGFDGVLSENNASISFSRSNIGFYTTATGYGGGALFMLSGGWGSTIGGYSFTVSYTCNEPNSGILTPIVQAVSGGFGSKNSMTFATQYGCNNTSTGVPITGIHLYYR